MSIQSELIALAEESKKAAQILATASTDVKTEL